ncbi:MAG: hypothetical protein LRY73_18090 [Bacillus sp. (in: Bacteria)]|nr:hypothetical protein [Bacillus sp. (in: firmicutes)]
MTNAKPLTTMDELHQQFFRDKRVQSAFNRYATYIGSTPYLCPATFGLIGYLELVDGVYYTKGGNSQIAKGFQRLAEELGVVILTDSEVEKMEVKDKQITGVVTKEGDHIEGDAFILNGDLLTQYPRLVAPEHRASFTMKDVEPSISAFVILAAVNERFDLNHHQLFFPENPEEEFHAIFKEQKFGSDPTIYICTSSKTENSRSPNGDNLFILVNAPPLSAHGDGEDHKKRDSRANF